MTEERRENKSGMEAAPSVRQVAGGGAPASRDGWARLQEIVGNKKRPPEGGR
jgi:hypothetical protein